MGRKRPPGACGFLSNPKRLRDLLIHAGRVGVSEDKRTAIEIQIIRNSLEQQAGKIRWVDHSGMYADCLTKRNGNAPLMQALMETGVICLTEESLTLEKHKADPKTKGSSKKGVATQRSSSRKTRAPRRSQTREAYAPGSSQTTRFNPLFFLRTCSALSFVELSGF